MSTFGGFPPELFTFFEGLGEEDSRDYWNANKTIWQEQVRKPMLTLLDELGEEFGPMRMFRPNRDVRFAKDKSPYKLWAGATSESRAVGGMGYCLEVSTAGMVTGYGAMAMARDQLHRFRAAIDQEASGREFEKLRAELTRRSLPITSGIDPALKRTPSGYPSMHPRAELLRWKGAAVVQQCNKADWMHTPVVLDKIRTIWNGTQPLKDWLDRHVGPMQEPVEPTRDRRAL